MQRKLSHILVVDDDPARRQEVVGMLKRRDYTVDSSQTVEEAYVRITEQPITLVVSSNRVGSTNGLQFIVGCRGRRSDVAGVVVAGQPEDVSEMDAWRHGVSVVCRPLNAEHFLMVIAEKLASIRQRQRWPRKKVTSYVPMHVERVPARLLDVSYGGLRFQLEGQPYGLRSSVRIEIPVSQLSVDAELVWSARVDGATCLCGVMLSNDRNADHAWRAFVDRVS
jgi:ActR/RegA family two-component response regulator